MALRAQYTMAVQHYAPLIRAHKISRVNFLLPCDAPRMRAIMRVCARLTRAVYLRAMMLFSC